MSTGLVAAPLSHQTGTVEDLRLIREVLEATLPSDNPIEPGILPTVVILNALGLITFASCEGHLWTDDDRITCAGPSVGPWIDFDVEDLSVPDVDVVDDTNEDDTPTTIPIYSAAAFYAGMDAQLAAYRAMDLANAHMHRTVLELLDAFYRTRRVPGEIRLIAFATEPRDSGFRLCSQGVQTANLLPPEEQRQQQKKYQAEMAAFTQFLHDKYLGIIWG